MTFGYYESRIILKQFSLSVLETDFLFLVNNQLSVGFSFTCDY